MRILGPLEVVRDGRVVRLGGRRPQAVLAVLAVHAGRVVPHEQLIEAAWDGRPPRTAPAVLRTYVAQLRAVIEPDVRSPDDARGAAGPDHWRVLLTQGPGYVLRTGAGQVDAERFGHLVEQGRRALAAGAHAEAADLLGEALALWRGPVLVGLAELEALGAYARRLDEDRWQAVEDRIEADLACGRHASLVGELQDLVEQEPLRERLCGQLMRALYRSGRQVSALSTYQALRERLADELGVDPAAELQRLHRAVLRHDPALAPPRAPVRPRTSAAGPRRGEAPRPEQDPATAAWGEWELRGRQAELTRLRDLFASGGGGAVVVGPPGVGKSRLSAEFVREHADAGHPTLRLSATSSGREIPLGCMAHVVSAAGHGGSTNLLPGDLVHSTVSALVARAAGAGRLVVSLDDAHLADPATITVVDQVVRASSAFLLATERAQEADPLVDLWKDGVIERVDLHPLPDPEMGRLLDAALGSPLATAARSRVLRLAGGSPLYLRELLRGALASGALTRRDGEWSLGGGFRPSDRLLDIVGERLRGLGPEESGALEAVAIAEPVPLPVLDRVASPEAVLGLELHDLVRVDDAAGAAVVLPAHPIYGEVVRARMPRLRRRHVSARLAQAFTGSALAEGYAVQHAVLCLDGGVAVDGSLLQVGAQRAQAGGDHDLALRLARAALDAGAGTTAALVGAESAAALGRLDLVEDLYRQAGERAASDEDDAGIVISQARGRLYGNDAQGAFALVDEAQRRLSGTEAGRALRLASAELKGFTGEWTVARDLALSLRSPDAPLETAFAADCVAAFAASFAGPHPVAAAAVRRASAARAAIPAPRPLALMWLELAHEQVRSFGGEPDAAVRDCIDRAERAVAGAEHPDWAGLWTFSAAAVAALAGSVTRTTRWMAEDALPLLRRRDVMNVYSFAVSTAALTAAMAGDGAAAERHLDHYDRDLRAGEQKSTVMADRARAWLLVRSSGPDAAAREALRVAAEVAEHVPLYTAVLAHDAVRFGRPEAAVPLLRGAADALDAPLATAMLGHGHAALGRDAGRLREVAREFARLRARQLAAEALTSADLLDGSARHVDEVAALTADEIVVAPGGSRN